VLLDRIRQQGNFPPIKKENILKNETNSKNHTHIMRNSKNRRSQRDIIIQIVKHPKKKMFCGDFNFQAVGSLYPIAAEPSPESFQWGTLRFCRELCVRAGGLTL